MSNSIPSLREGSKYRASMEEVLSRTGDLENLQNVTTTLPRSPKGDKRNLVTDRSLWNATFEAERQYTPPTYEEPFEINDIPNMFNDTSETGYSDGDIIPHTDADDSYGSGVKNSTALQVEPNIYPPIDQILQWDPRSSSTDRPN